jgi:hypothetical protein
MQKVLAMTLDNIAQQGYLSAIAKFLQKDKSTAR